MRRRHLLRAACALPAGWLAGCGPSAGAWPEGMAPIAWDRDVCRRCGMAISDRRFAVQVRGGPKAEALKFDDIGCAATFCSERRALVPWVDEPATRWWVADFEAPAPGGAWLAARTAFYGAGPRSPMGYDLAAYATPAAGRLDFTTMATQTAATLPANCRTEEKTA